MPVQLGSSGGGLQQIPSTTTRTEESVWPMSGNPANEAELQALRVAELRDLCKTNGLEHKGLKAELQERLREHLFKDPSVAGGEVSVSTVSGGGSGSPREGNEAWRTPTEQVTFSCDGEVGALLLRTLPSEHDRKAHSIAGGWLAEALYKMHGGKEVTKALLTRTRITFKGAAGVEKTMYVTRVPESSEDYCDLITAAGKALQSHQPLPLEMTAYDAEAALDDVLTALRAREAGPMATQAPASVAIDLREALESVATGLKSATVPAVKFGVADFGEAQKQLRFLGHPLCRRNCPKFSQVGDAKKSVLAKDGEMNVPLLPVDAHLQPGMLKPVVDQRTGQHNRDMPQRVGIEDGRLSVVEVEEIAPKKGRSAYEVCHGYTMYWVMVAVLSTQITRLADNYLCLTTSMFLHPYYLQKFMNTMAHVVGTSGLNGDALDAILNQQLLTVQSKVNDDTDHPWAGDQCLEFMCEELPKQIAMARSLMLGGGAPRGTGDGDTRRGGRPNQTGVARQVRSVYMWRKQHAQCR